MIMIFIFYLNFYKFKPSRNRQSFLSILFSDISIWVFYKFSPNFKTHSKFSYKKNLPRRSCFRPDSRAPVLWSIRRALDKFQFGATVNTRDLAIFERGKVKVSSSGIHACVGALSSAALKRYVFAKEVSSKIIQICTWLFRKPADGKDCFSAFSNSLLFAKNPCAAEYASRVEKALWNVRTDKRASLFCRCSSKEAFLTVLIGVLDFYQIFFCKNFQFLKS